MTVTYLDSGVLIEGWHNREVPEHAVEILLQEPGRAFVASRVQRLETVARVRGPLAAAERAYYATYFERVSRVYTIFDEALGFDAERLTLRYDLAPLDALHMASALRAGAHEFVTTEKPGKPLYRVRELRVVHLPVTPRNQPTTP